MWCFGAVRLSKNECGAEHPPRSSWVLLSTLSGFSSTHMYDFSVLMGGFAVLPCRRSRFGAAFPWCSAFDVVLHKGRVGEIYNLASPFEISNLELARVLLRKFSLPPDREVDFIQFHPNRPFNDCRYFIDGSKLHELGWSSRVDFDTGLELTIDWYRKHFDTWWENPQLALVPHPVFFPSQQKFHTQRSDDTQ